MKSATRAFWVALSFLVLPAMGEETDARFVIPTKASEFNPLMKGASDGLLKVYGREGFRLTNMGQIRKVGATYLLSFSFTLDKMKDPVTEKDFAKINEGLEPFFRSQADHYKKAGKKISALNFSFASPETAEGYNAEKSPAMFYIISGEDEDLFWMKVTFSERTGGFMVAEFTIAAV